jgi:hypothetical protein
MLLLLLHCGLVLLLLLLLLRLLTGVEMLVRHRMQMLIHDIVLAWLTSRCTQQARSHQWVAVMRLRLCGKHQLINTAMHRRATRGSRGGGSCGRHSQRIGTHKATKVSMMSVVRRRHSIGSILEGLLRMELRKRLLSGHGSRGIVIIIVIRPFQIIAFAHAVSTASGCSHVRVMMMMMVVGAIRAHQPCCRQLHAQTSCTQHADTQNTAVHQVAAITLVILLVHAHLLAITTALARCAGARLATARTCPAANSRQQSQKYTTNKYELSGLGN